MWKGVQKQETVGNPDYSALRQRSKNALHSNAQQTSFSTEGVKRVRQHQADVEAEECDSIVSKRQEV